MAISNNTPRVQITANGTVGPFTFNFRIFAEEDLRVFDEGTLKTLTTDYTILFDFEDPEAEAGTITFEVAATPTSGNTLTIDRRVEAERDTDFQLSGPPIQIPLNLEFDKVFAKIQEIEEAFNRLVRLSETTEFVGDVIFPDGGATAIGKGIFWNDVDGLTLENKDVLTIGAQTFPLALLQGGTGAAYASLSALRTGIGLEIGLDVQAYDIDIPFINVEQEWTSQQNFDAAVKNAAGADLVTNGAFAADTDWTKGTGWTITGGVADVDGTQVADSDLEQSITVTNTDSYEVTFTVSSWVAGTITPRIGGTAGTARGANGTFTEVIVAGAGASPELELRADATGDMQIDNVIVKAVNVSWDAATEQVLELTLDASGLILDNPTNINAGSHYTVKVIQDATGGRTLSFGTAFKWPNAGIVPTVTTDADAIDILSFYCDGTNMHGIASQNFA